tara:strand:- start:2077 stop:2652 length:576 start_codon:yes stop_codon:yes gene_type:complete
MLNLKIINYFFKQAEIGNWEEIQLLEAEKRLGLKKNTLDKLFKDKIYFLAHFDRYIDEKVIKSVSYEDISSNNSEDIIQEYIMNKLDFMNDYKLGISNIINFYFNNPKFYLVSLKSTKSTTQIYLNQFNFSNNKIRKKLFEKVILALFLLAFKKWLYEDSTNSGAFALIDKGIKRIKTSTTFFEDLTYKKK